MGEHVIARPRGRTQCSYFKSQASLLDLHRGHLVIPQDSQRDALIEAIHQVAALLAGSFGHELDFLFGRFPILDR